jgi:L-seryl-tRNA(Ser) seleniumtransferase
LSNDALRLLPSIDRLLAAAAWEEASQVPHAIRRDACREVVDGARTRILGGELDGVDEGAMIRDAVALAVDRVRPVLRPVINATGVILHTNLGRAPLPRAAVDAIVAAAGRYTNIEMSLETGRRDHRLTKLSAAFSRVLGAPDVVVVNNNAAAVFLVLKALAGDGTGVAVSRGEQVEIGGSFRIPDILAEAGGRMIEVGTTNRTHLRDYMSAMDAGARILLKVHRSNFSIVGFTKEVPVSELVELTREREGIVVYDLGSGLLWGDLAGGEDTVRGALEAGVDVVCFSGDKLLGGPQCGIVVGRADLVERIRTHPLMRMLRPGKLQLLALEATLLAWERDPSGGEIPAARAMSRPRPELKRAAQRLRDRLAPLLPDELAVTVTSLDSTPGGGSAPGVLLASWGVAIEGPGTAQLAGRLRRGDPPVVARMEDGRLLMDVRTLLSGDEDAIVARFED